MDQIIVLGVFTSGWMLMGTLLWVFIIRHENKHNKLKPNLLRKYQKLRKIY